MIKVVCNIQSTTREKLIEKFASPRNFKVASDHTFEVNRPFTFPKPSPHFSVNYYIPKVATFKGRQTLLSNNFAQFLSF